MRFFSVLDYQHELLGAILGLVAALILYLSFRSYYFTKERADETAEQKFDYPDEIHGINHPMPPHLIFVLLGFIVWYLFYLIVFGIFGNPI